MDFKRKLGHGLSALFSSDDEIDREIERMEKAQTSQPEDNPFSKDSETQSTISNEMGVSYAEHSPFDNQSSSEETSGTSSVNQADSNDSFSVSEEKTPQVQQNADSDVVSTSYISGFSTDFPVPSGFSSENQQKSIYDKLEIQQNDEDSLKEGSEVIIESATNRDLDDHQDMRKENDSDPVSEMDISMENRSDSSDPDLLKDRIQLIDIYKIEPDRQQPRKSFDSAQLSELAASIKQYGVLSPLLVSKEEEYFKIIAGERRYRAARMAGLEKLPVIIREFDEQDKMAVALIENIQRQELNPMEEANAYRTLMDKYRMTQEEIAEKLNKSRSSIANLLRLQKLPESVQKSLSEGLISFGHAKVLLGVEDPIDQTRLALQVVSNNLSVRELEDLVRAGNTNGKKKTKNSKSTGKVQTFSHRLAEDRLKDKLSTKVSVNGGKRKGNITIEFYSQDDLERILTILGI